MDIGHLSNDVRHIYIRYFCAYRWSWCLALLFFCGTGASGGLEASLAIPSHLAHYWQPVFSSRREILFADRSRRGLLVILGATVSLCPAFFSRAADSWHASASLSCRVEFRHTVTFLGTLAAHRRTAASLQPAFGSALYWRGACGHTLGTWAQHPTQRVGLTGRSLSGW